MNRAIILNATLACNFFEKGSVGLIEEMERNTKGGAKTGVLELVIKTIFRTIKRTQAYKLLITLYNFVQSYFLFILIPVFLGKLIWYIFEYGKREDSIPSALIKSCKLIICGYILLKISIHTTRTTIIKFAQPYGLKPEYMDEMKKSEILKLIKENPESLNERVYKGEKCDRYSVCGKFLEEYLVYPAALLNNTRAHFEDSNLLHSSLLGIEGKYKQYERLFAYYTSNVDLKEYIMESQQILANRIKLSMHVRGKADHVGGVFMHNPKAFILDIMGMVMQVRMFGKESVMNKELTLSVLKIANPPSKNKFAHAIELLAYYHRLNTSSCIPAYLDQELNRKLYTKNSTTPRDIVQFLSENPEVFDLKDRKLISYTVRSIITVGIEILQPRIQSIITEVALRSSVYKDLLMEQMRIKKHYGTTILYEHLDKMEILDAVIKETIRCTGSQHYMSRWTTKDVVLSNGKTIPAKNLVSFNLYVHHLNKSLFGNNPETFNYKRHLASKTKLKDISIENVIWGIGPRMCLARKFSIAVMKLVLAIIIRNYSFFPLTRPKNNIVVDPFCEERKNVGIYFVPH